jgi:hypothetical protein
MANPCDNRRRRLSLPRQVKAEIKFVVVPIRVMVAAPLAGFVHSGDVVVYLVTAVAVTQYIAVDSGPVWLKSTLAFRSMVSVSASRGAEAKG